MIKKYLLLFFFSLAGNFLSAQILQPVKWNFYAKKIQDKTYEIHLVAIVEKNWHIYSQTTPSGGPIPTSLTFEKNPLITLVGKTKEEGDVEEHFEKIFNVKVKQFSNKVDFIQRVKIKNKTALVGTVEYMACDNKQCLPPTMEDFSIKLN